MEEYQQILQDLNIDTSLYDEVLGSENDIRGEIFSLAESIEMISWMLKPKEERGYARDKEKDSKGKIIVDITKPHVLEDMDFFRQPALHFNKHGKYTSLYPNPHPNSEYKKYWDEEMRRCKEGLVRPSDGEWITGYYYWYLNYSPIWVAVDIRDEKGKLTGKADRFKLFPDVWDSDYMFFHYVQQGDDEGLFGALLKTRGRGYSFKIAGMLSRNYFMFKGSKSFALASDSEYLDDDGLLSSKTWDVLDWVDEHTPFTKGRLKNSILKKISGYVDPIDKLEKGYKSEITGVTTGGNPEKGRGKRGKLLVYEEAGKFPHLLKTWTIARPSVEQGNSTFGYMLAFGTGGSIGADFSGIEELFYRGKAHRVKMLPNVFDKVKGNGRCALYIGEYFNRQNCYDENGNSNVYKALDEILTARKIIRENAGTSEILVQEKAERSITPQEAVLRFEGTIFPVSDLKTYLEEISPMMHSFLAEHLIGDLVFQNEDGEVIFKPNADAKVQRDFPIKDNKNKEGAFEIFKLPIKSPMGDISRKRYIGGIDTYDDDESGTNSLGSIFIMDMLTDEIVAEYTGRPQTANKFYENCLKLLKFYNAEALYESNKKGLFAYFSSRHCLSYLADVPEILKDLEMIKGTNLGGNKAKGANANPKVNAWGRRLQADYMLSPVEGQEETGLVQLQRLRSITYIKEAIGWNEDANFDRISSMGMLMILREEYKKYIFGLREEASGEKRKYIGNDPFFQVNYRQDRKELDTDMIKSILKENKKQFNLNEL